MCVRDGSVKETLWRHCSILQIRQAELQLTQLNNDLEKHEDEQDYMKGMLKTLGQELKTIDVSATRDVAASGLFCFSWFLVLFCIQALGQAKGREVESVKHLTALEDREIGHLTGESSKINKEQRSLGDRRNTQEVCV